MTAPQTKRCCLEFNRVAGGEFRAALLQAIRHSPFHRENIDLKSSYDSSQCFLSENGEAGFAISSTHELMSVFSCTSGGGSSAVRCAQANFDHLHLNCYGTSYLRGFYEKNGFEVVRKEASYIPGKRDVLFMEWHR